MFAVQRTGVLGIAALCVALATACLGRSAPVRFYTMSPMPAAVAADNSTPVPYIVGPMRFPRYLERPQIVTREGSELKFNDLNRWAAGFEANVEAVLAENLRDRVGSNPAVSGSVVANEAVRVLVDFVEFEGRDDALVLRARWSLRNDRGPDRNWSEETALRRPIKADDLPSLVRAHDEALAGLADAIAARLLQPGNQLHP